MTLSLLKVHLQTFLSIPITQKCQILSCDTFVANERYFRPVTRGWRQMQFQRFVIVNKNGGNPEKNTFNNTKV
jgi:hypothetical protein